MAKAGRRVLQWWPSLSVVREAAEAAVPSSVVGKTAGATSPVLGGGVVWAEMGQ
ncbi:hypothetical protein Dimus_018769, partial [Dionaea muscipula]